MEITCKVDASKLNMAHEILARHSTRSPARCINSTAYHVIKPVADNFPEEEQSQIDTDMEVIVTPKLVKTGLRKGQPLKSGATEIEVPDMSMAMLITIARMNPNSKYSLMTGNRWPIASQGGWRGMIGDFAKSYGHENAMAMAMEAVRETAERMVRARHSSTGFLKKSWVDLKTALIPFAMGRNKSTASIVTEDWFNEIIPAKEGYPLAVCTVSNTLGVGNKTTKELSEKYNKANHRIAEPMLAASIQREFDSKVRLAASKEWADDEPALKALGVMVSP